MKRNNIFGISIALTLLMVAMTGCKEHIIQEETLPQPVVDFSYEVADDTYLLDFYAGCTVRFYPTTTLSTECTWQIGDQTLVGDTVLYKFPTAGNFTVTAMANGGKMTHPILIAPIRPIMRLVQTDSICVVDSAFVAFEVELPNPENFEAEYKWTLPGVTNTEGQTLTEFIGTDKELGQFKFSASGSQQVRLEVTFIDSLGNRQPLDAVSRNVQVALREPAPTLYYAVKDGNIMACKLTDEAGAQHYDMGIASGQHPFNILFDDNATNSLYILDAGKQFIYVNDENGVQGDGKISVMAADASSLGVVISNVGGPAFQDPFYGCLDGNFLYYSDRNTGVFRIPITTRNEVWSKDAYPYYVQNAQLGYYSRGLAYGAITGCFGKVEGTWYWAKTFHGNGIWRFVDSDILPDANSYEKATAPTAGSILTAFYTKAFAYDADRKQFYFSIYGSQGAGVYTIPFADIDVLAKAGSASDLKPYLLSSTVSIEPIAEKGKNEGSDGEFIGICQMAIDEATGDVYFGYRSTNKSESGLYRYNYNDKSLKLVAGTEGKEIYGVSIKQTPTQLF